MKNKILNFGFLAILFFFSINSFITRDKEISFSERRKLTTFPKVSISAILDGTFFEDLNDYFVDQFPYRDQFRKVKGIINSSFLNKKDNNGVFLKNNTIYQLDTNLNEKSIAHFTKVLNKVQTKYLDSNAKIYYSIIPDKNYYLTDKSIPKLDYQRMQEKIAQQINSNFQYIDITKTLNSHSYYQTDIHWKQEEIKPVVQQLSTTMNFKITDYPTTSNTYYPFYGALYGRIASNIEPDTLTYLTNDTIDSLNVFNYEKNITEKVYQEEYLKGVDSYDIYLSGATPLLIITNKKQTNNRELIIFRDSFGSSITPLIASSYSKITLIDLRYLSSDLLATIDELDFTHPNLDILFLYSTPVINNSFTLK